jgi:hypothetical protein
MTMSKYLRPQITEGLRDSMNRVGSILGEVFEGRGFALLVFDFGPDGMMNYLSNASREDMLVAMREFIATHEASTHDAPKEVQ